MWFSLAIPIVAVALIEPLADALALLTSTPSYFGFGNWDGTMLIITMAIFLLLSFPMTWFMARVYEAMAVRSNPTVETDARNSGARGSL